MRDLPLSNGSFALGSWRCAVHGISFPRVGQNQTQAYPNGFGVWADGQFHWLDSEAWQRDERYEDGTLVTRVTCTSEGLGLELACADCIDYALNVYLKRLMVRDLSGHDREIRL